MLLSILLIFLVTREKRTESNEFFLRLNHRNANALEICNNTVWNEVGRMNVRLATLVSNKKIISRATQ